MAATSKQFGRTFLGGWISKLKFPQLFTFAAALFFIDLLVPDMIPFLDEILLAATTLLLANLKDKSVVQGREDREEKDITPRG